MSYGERLSNSLLICSHAESNSTQKASKPKQIDNLEKGKDIESSNDVTISPKNMREDADAYMQDSVLITPDHLCCTQKYRFLEPITKLQKERQDSVPKQNYKLQLTQSNRPTLLWASDHYY